MNLSSRRGGGIGDFGRRFGGGEQRRDNARLEVDHELIRGGVHMKRAQRVLALPEKALEQLWQIIFKFK